MLIDSETMLEKSKQNMKRDLMSSLENWQSGCVDLYSNLTEQMPTEGDIKIEDAFEKIGEFQAQIKAVQERKVGLKMGLDLFETELPEPKELAKAEKDLKLDGAYVDAAQGLDAEVRLVEDGPVRQARRRGHDQPGGPVHEEDRQAQARDRALGRLGAHAEDGARVCRHHAAHHGPQEPRAARAPLERPQGRAAQGLRPGGVDFTLEKVFDIGLNTVADFIGELSGNANKELAIETASRRSRGGGSTSSST